MSRIMEWPDAWYRVASGTFTLQSKNLRTSSPWTGRQSISGPISQMFSASIQLAPQESSFWMAMEAFFAEAAGSASIIRMSDFARRQPQFNREARPERRPWSDNTYFTDDTGWVSGLIPPYVFSGERAAKGSSSLLIGGLETFASLPRVLRRGDDFEVRRNGVYSDTPSLHRIIRDAAVNSSGMTRLEFRPSFRKGVAEGDMIVFQNPQGNFRLIDDNQAVVQRSLPRIGDLGFELIEALI